jgi:hypothetical protein
MAARILKVTNYGETEAENKEVTISPMVIKAVMADVVAHEKQGRAVKNVALLLIEGDTMELVISDRDLYTLEEVVGSYDWE